MSAVNITNVTMLDNPASFLAPFHFAISYDCGTPLKDAFLPLLFWGHEFVRVGYYINNDFEDERLREEPPQKVQVDKVPRTILYDKPRSTKFPINFHPENSGSKEQSTPLEHQAEIKVDREEPFDLPIGAGEANAEKPDL